MIKERITHCGYLDEGQFGMVFGRRGIGMRNILCGVCDRPLR